METPKKRHVISLEVKKQVIEAAVNKKPKEISDKFGLPQSTVKTILGNKVAILKALDEGSEARQTEDSKARRSRRSGAAMVQSGQN